MSLIKIVKEKIAEGTSLKDIKHIIKRQKEGKALANFNRWAEELIIKKMITDGKTTAEVLSHTTEINHFELKWNEKRLEKLAGQATKEKTQTDKEKVKAEKKAAKEKIKADKAEAKAKAKADKQAAKDAKKADKAAKKEAAVAAAPIRRKKIPVEVTDPAAATAAPAPATPA